jgi:hypothetical protein
MMNRFDQRRPCVAEKVAVQQTRRDTRRTGRKIGSTCGEARQAQGGPRCGAVTGKSVHGPMT